MNSGGRERVSTATGDGSATSSRHLRARRSLRREIVELQRSRVLYAAIDAVEDVGYARMTVGEVLSRARVSRNTFYALFSDREQCFLAAFELVLDQMRQLAVQAYEGQSSWRDGIRAALAALLDFIDEQPGLGRLCIVEVLAGGDCVLRRRTETLGELEHAIDLGRAAGQRDPQALTANDPRGLTAESVLGGVLAILHRRLSRGDAEPLRPLLRELMHMIVLPYLGADTALAELRIDDAEPQAMRPAALTRAKDPWQGVNTRVTYRTVRALSAISASPGASNLEVALAAGVVDQGQISKLLSRLASLGLIENHGAGQSPGTANAWHLTERGEQLERTARRSA